MLSAGQKVQIPSLRRVCATSTGSQQQGIHFNSSTMRFQATHSPLIYDKLVFFVDIEETGSNYKLLTRPAAWDSHAAEQLKLGTRARSSRYMAAGGVIPEQ
ncbi:hypothetical protein CF336_g2280 [Tilletia laevis]|nr:hypothetical protein CF336_g2280 [Tilletia laevis]KAE8202509.1 hypothetical protein CF335_g3393 [Tilletia laevis]KAE8237012.1 hypothetical protein A4X03_0g9248 [Tilletia caries]